MKNNKLIVGDTEYEIDQAYRDGAEAARKGRPWMSDRYPGHETKSDQWNYGHTNEADGMHIQHGVDVIESKATGAIF